jgi:membrane-bound lytic murein transglycosylase D
MKLRFLHLFACIIVCLNCVTLVAQKDSTSIDSNRRAALDLSWVDRYDSLLLDHLKLLHSFTNDTVELNTFNYPSDSIPRPDESVVKERLSKLDEQSPFEFKYNDATAAMIRLYTYKRHRLTSRMLGLGELYFPLFEEKLIAHNMPIELKYLPIVESALKPHARSHAGAGGLWQFMPATGRSYGLDITSYVDERGDPYMATEAACKYLSKLYAIYGDWSMALAAYNCGPGNVNKAIRRSGGKTDFWGIRPFLPKETQNYVPAFIAVNYVMNYASAHNIYPKTPEFFDFEMDTVRISKRVDLGVLEYWIGGYNRRQLSYLNPIFLTEVIPATDEFFVLKMPANLIGEFLCYEDSIYKYSALEYKYWVAENKPSRVLKYHYIKSGESMSTIAKEYECSEQDILAWNTRTKIRMKSGRKLVVFEPVNSASNPKSVPASSKNSSEPKPLIANSSRDNDSGEYFYHTIQKGDTLWDISQKYSHTSLDEIKSLNSHLDFNRLKTGTKIKIEKK